MLFGFMRTSDSDQAYDMTPSERGLYLIRYPSMAIRRLPEAISGASCVVSRHRPGDELRVKNEAQEHRLALHGIVRVCVSKRTKCTEGADH